MAKAPIALLQSIPLFGGMSADALEILLANAVEQHFPRGHWLFRENDAADFSFVLDVGEVAVIKHAKGRDYLLTTLGRGDVVGEMSLLDLQPRSASVLAMEDCHTLRITTRDFHHLRRRDLAQFTLLNLNMAREVCRRLRLADDRLFETCVREGTGGYSFKLNPTI